MQTQIVFRHRLQNPIEANAFLHHPMKTIAHEDLASVAIKAIEARLHPKLGFTSIGQDMSRAELTSVGNTED